MQKWKQWSKKMGLALALGLVGWLSLGTVVRAQLNVSNFMPSEVPVQPNASELVTNIVNLVFVLGAMLTFCFLVYGAIQWITAGGESAKVEEARKKITGAIVGLLILASTWAVFTLVMQVAFGTNPAGVQLPSLTGGGGGGGGSEFTCGKDGKTGSCPSGQSCVSIGSGKWTCRTN